MRKFANLLPLALLFSLVVGPRGGRAATSRRNLREPRRRRHRAAPRLRRLRCGEAHLHHQRQRREHVAGGRRLPVRLEEDFGDVTLTADISFLTTTGNEHKKAVLILRQTLDADSVYVDVALHASGLTSLQFRDEKGAVTREVQSNFSAPKRLRIAKRGDYVYMSLAADGGDPKVCRRMAAHSAARPVLRRHRRLLTR